jgi:hypothetical protein
LGKAPEEKLLNEGSESKKETKVNKSPGNIEIILSKRQPPNDSGQLPFAIHY